MDADLISLKILLPFRLFAEEHGVKRMVADTGKGLFGILPKRLDCVAPLAPGILIYEGETGSETYVAVDEGVLVKTGLNVLVSVRNAIGGTDLGRLRETVEKEFRRFTAQERDIREELARAETGFIRRLAEFHHG